MASDEPPLSSSCSTSLQNNNLLSTSSCTDTTHSSNVSTGKYGWLCSVCQIKICETSKLFSMNSSDILRIRTNKWQKPMMFVFVMLIDYFSSDQTIGRRRGSMYYIRQRPVKPT